MTRDVPRHIPASHPVLRRTVSFSRMEDAMDKLALDVANLPDWPLSDEERVLLQIIVSELSRRATA